MKQRSGDKERRSTGIVTMGEDGRERDVEENTAVEVVQD